MVWQKFSPEADEIIEGLFIGNGSAAFPLEKWKYTPVKNSEKRVVELKLDAIVNCTPKLENFHQHLQYFRVPINDKDKTYTDRYIMEEYLRTAAEFIHSFLDDKKRVMVHCMAGITRSSTVVAAYLIIHKKMSYEDAIKYIRSKRPKAFTLKSVSHIRYEAALLTLVK